MGSRVDCEFDDPRNDGTDFAALAAIASYNSIGQGFRGTGVVSPVGFLTAATRMRASKQRQMFTQADRGEYAAPLTAGIYVYGGAQELRQRNARL